MSAITSVPWLFRRAATVSTGSSSTSRVPQWHSADLVANADQVRVGEIAVPAAPNRVVSSK